jgi:cell division protein FtsB
MNNTEKLTAEIRRLRARVRILERQIEEKSHVQDMPEKRRESMCQRPLRTM